MNRLVERHAGERMLVMGTYLEPLRGGCAAPRCTAGDRGHAHAERERIYAAFRSGETRTLVLSRVGNFAIDLPEASVLIQLSGTMGSRQEEAQRLDGSCGRSLEARASTRSSRVTRARRITRTIASCS